MLFLNETIDVAGKLTVADIPLLIGHVLASIVMLACLSFFVYRPFRRWSKARASRLKNDFDKTQTLLGDAQKKDALAQEKLTKVQLLTKQMVSETNSRSLATKKTILAEAETLKKQMLAEAKLEVGQIRKKNQKEIEKAILINAIHLSEKLLLASLNPKQHQQLIDDFLKNLDE